ncbi:MAG: hypothetical protein GXP38_00400 [Chloroflexi bacterium]|nr:hypothetical protein [Chloroflexota bacterium]
MTLKPLPDLVARIGYPLTIVTYTTALSRGSAILIVNMGFLYISRMWTIDPVNAPWGLSPLDLLLHLPRA